MPSLSVRSWEISAAPAFFSWREESGVAVSKMTTFAQAVHRTIVAEGWWRSSLADIAPRLPEVLRDCDNLTFDTDAEVRAYAALHLVDRYGRCWSTSSPSAGARSGTMGSRPGGRSWPSACAICDPRFLRRPRPVAGPR